MSRAKLAAAIGSAALASAVIAACGSSEKPRAVAVSHGEYACHELAFAGLHPKISFPQLVLTDSAYTIGELPSGTYTATATGDATTIAFKGGLLGGLSARYDAAKAEVTFGGPHQDGNTISDAPGLICARV